MFKSRDRYLLFHLSLDFHSLRRRTLREHPAQALPNSVGLLGKVRGLFRHSEAQLSASLSGETVFESDAVKLPRRTFLHLAAGAAALPAVSRMAWAQAYPSRPVRVIVPFAPAGDTDLVARLMGQWLSERLGQPFIIENRPGAGTNIGTEAVVRAPADGYTLLLASPPAAINATLYDKLNFVFLRDIAPVAGVIRAPFVMEVNTSVPAKTVPEFIVYAKANLGKISMASAGIGSGPHVAGELFKIMAAINIIHVPYRGQGPALTDLLGGQVQLYFAGIPSSIPYIRAGKLRALAVTTAMRSEALPDIPTLSDFLPGYEASFWGGFCAPKNTPAEIVDTLNKEINAGLADPKMKARIADLGATVLPGSPAAFGTLIADETEKWGKVIKAANIKAE
jgi:tripartite-type tricarboxylate transporter receptor subunit TctC